MASGVSLHFEKHKANDATINGLQRHNNRVKGQKHSNENIDDSRTEKNVFLRKSLKRYNTKIDDIIEKNRIGGKKGVRKDAVRMISATVQLSDDVLKMSEEKQEQVLRDSFEYLKENFGEKNILSSVIHKDETSMHLHFDFVPVTKNGKLSAKDILSRNNLKKYQRESLAYLQERHKDCGFERKGGTLNGLKQKDFEIIKDEQKRLKEKESRVNAKEDLLKKQAEDLRKRSESLKLEKMVLEKEKEALKENRIEINKRLEYANNSLTESFEYKRELNKSYNAKWGEFKDEMSQIREAQDELWNDPQKRQKWDVTASKLRDARDFRQKMQGGGTWLSAIFNIIATIQEETYQAQLDTMERVRKQTENQLKEQRQNAIDSLNKAKEARNAINGEIGQKMALRDNLRRELSELDEKGKELSKVLKSRVESAEKLEKRANEKIEELKQGLLPFQLQARSQKNEAMTLLEEQKELLQQQNKYIENNDITRLQAQLDNEKTMEKIENKQQAINKDELSNDEVLELLLDDIQKGDELTL